MRSILTALLLAAVPGAAFAECTCTCNGGQVVPICTLASDIAPICQRICLSPVTQTIYNAPLTTPISGGNLGVNAAPGGTSTDPAAIAAGRAAGIPSLDAAGTAVGGYGSSGAAAAAAGAGGAAAQGLR